MTFPQSIKNMKGRIVQALGLSAAATGTVANSLQIKKHLEKYDIQKQV